MLAGAASELTEHAETVRVVDHQSRAVAILQSHELGQLAEVAFHGEHAVDDDHLADVVRRHGELALEVFHVVVLELDHLGEAETRAVDDAGVIQCIEEDHVLATEEAAQHSEVHLEAGGEGERGLALHERGETILELDVEVERAVQEAGAGAARAVALDGLDGGRLDLGVVGQPEVVVRPEHDHAPTVDRDDGVLRGLDAAEVVVEPLTAKRVGQLVIAALVEDIHGIPPAFTAHRNRGAPALPGRCRTSLYAQARGRAASPAPSVASRSASAGGRRVHRARSRVFFNADVTDDQPRCSQFSCSGASPTPKRVAPTPPWYAAFTPTGA